MPKKIAVVLSGCGNKDGTEITEAVSLMIALSQQGATVQYFAPNQEFPAQNFLTDLTLPAKRNALVESARITRSQIKDLATLDPQDFDGIALPGGFGAAMNLSTWAQKGAACTVNADLEKALHAFYRTSKPIAAICIAPALIARVLGSKKITLTVGADSEAALEIKKTGAIHEACPVDDFITDRLHKIISTPAYMYDAATPAQVFRGVSGLAKELVEMA
ncbi:MAG: isoprenoid biosynthesis glyoxalase ElbB [Bdellovibrio sp.]|jgi:enhancing lycopene biosynthesis protein 2